MTYDAGRSCCAEYDQMKRRIAELEAQLAAPTPPAPVVTEEMVEIGAAGMYGKEWNNPDPQKRPGEKMKDVWRKLSRDALTVALSRSGPARQ